MSVAAIAAAPDVAALRVPSGAKIEVWVNGVACRKSAFYVTIGVPCHACGRDPPGDDVPPCELKRLSRPDEPVGLPWCHGADGRESAEMAGVVNRISFNRGG
jgi:hypothetical protein